VQPIHKCMTESIHYDDKPPRGYDSSPIGFTHTARKVCAAGSMHLSGVRPSVRPSLSANFAAAARPAGDIDRLLHGAQQRGGRMRAVARCQRTREAEHAPTYWRCASLRNRVYVTVRCPSVCLSIRPPHSAAAGLLVWPEQSLCNGTESVRLSVPFARHTPLLSGLLLWAEQSLCNGTVSVSLSVPFARHTPLLSVCCCGPGSMKYHLPGA